MPIGDIILLLALVVLANIGAALLLGLILYVAVYSLTRLSGAFRLAGHWKELGWWAMAIAVVGCIAVVIQFIAFVM